jgi:thymidylate synthase
MFKYSQLYKSVLNEVYSHWIESNPRWMKIKEKLFWTLIYSPMQCISEFEWKEYSFRYLYWEILWYLSWWRESSFISQFASLWSKIKDENWELNSNYWNLVFYKKHFYDWLESQTQYDWCLKSLLDDKETRQAIIHYNSSDHQKLWVKDFPCTLYQQFFIRDNKLNWITNMRSNDLFYWTNYDVVWFALVMQSLYIDLKKVYEDLKIWDIMHVWNSLHIYEKDFTKTEAILSSKKDEDYLITVNRSIKDIIWDWFDPLEYSTLTQTNEEYINTLSSIWISISKI